MTQQHDPKDITFIATLCHELNRAYCLLLGDTSQSHWTDAPDWQKDSAKSGVLAALEGKTPQELHASWQAQKIAEGWTWGWVKDPEKKEHPCIVESYDELPPAQQLKDQLFSNMVQFAKAQLQLIEDSAHDPLF